MGVLHLFVISCVHAGEMTEERVLRVPSCLTLSRTLKGQQESALSIWQKNGVWKVSPLRTYDTCCEKFVS